MATYEPDPSTRCTAHECPPRAALQWKPDGAGWRAGDWRVFPYGGMWAASYKGKMLRIFWYPCLYSTPEDGKRDCEARAAEPPTKRRRVRRAEVK